MAIATTPRKTTAPAAIGWTMEPTIVAAKIAKRRHDAVVIPSGAPAARMRKAVAKTAAQRQITYRGVSGPACSPGTCGTEGVGMAGETTNSADCQTAQDP